MFLVTWYAYYSLYHITSNWKTKIANVLHQSTNIWRLPWNNCKTINYKDRSSLRVNNPPLKTGTELRVQQTLTHTAHSLRLWMASPLPTQPLHMQIKFDVWQALGRELHAADVDRDVRIEGSKATRFGGFVEAGEYCENLITESKTNMKQQQSLERSFLLQIQLKVFLFSVLVWPFHF